jgi:hypothetical protein
MILIDFLAMILLYAVYTVIQPVKKKNDLGDALFVFLAGFGFIFLTLDVIEKMKGLF